MWYSFNYGSAHFVSINTETDWPGAEEQDLGDGQFKKFPAGHFAPNGTFLQWLENDLRMASQERGRRPWIIVGGHRPLHELAQPGGAAIAALLRKYEVDMYLAGHEHYYARYPQVCGGPSERCTQPIVIGGPGCDEMAFTHESQVHTQTGKPGPIFFTNHAATGVLDVSPSELHFRLLASTDGAILDEVRIRRPQTKGTLLNDLAYAVVV